MPHNSKGAEKKSVLPGKFRGQIGAGFFQKGPKRGWIFKQFLVPFLFLYEFIEKVDFSQILSLKWFKTIGPSFIKTREKFLFFERAKFFQRQNFLASLAELSWQELAKHWPLICLNAGSIVAGELIRCTRSGAAQLITVQKRYLLVQKNMK